MKLSNKFIVIIGILTDKDIRVIREFIKDNYKEMYLCWAKMSPNGF